MTEFPVGSPLPGALGSGRREVLTVAQLLSRMSSGAAAYTPVAREPGASGTQIVSVGSLLRREGRAPHAQDRPLQPRAARQAEQAALAGAERSGAWPARPASGRRRATAVAGALVAAGSVLGAALYNGAASHSSDAQAAADGLFPGLGLPSGAPAAGLPPEYLPANVALTSPLPAPAVLTPGTMDWTRLAFGPGPSAPAAGALAGAPSAPGGLVPAARGAAAATPTAPVPPTSSGGGGGQASGGGGGGLLPGLTGGDRTPAGNVLDPVLGGGSGGGSTGGSGGGGATPGPVQRVTEPLRPVGETAGGVLRPVAEAAAPVGRTVGDVAAPVTGTVRPLTRSLQPVTTPLATAVEPVTTPVLQGVSPITEPVLEGTKPLTGPVIESLDPVTDLLNTSAAGDQGGAQATGKHSRTDATDPSNTVSGLTERLGGTVSTLTGGGQAPASSTAASSSKNTSSKNTSPKTKTKDLLGSTVGSLTGN